MKNFYYGKRMDNTISVLLRLVVRRHFDYPPCFSIVYGFCYINSRNILFPEGRNRSTTGACASVSERLEKLDLNEKDLKSLNKKKRALKR